MCVILNRDAVASEEKLVVFSNLVSKLRDNGIREVTVTASKDLQEDSHALQNLIYLPLDNLVKILEQDYSPPNLLTLNDVYKFWETEGLLDFKPYLTYDRHDDIVLVLEVNRFVKFNESSDKFQVLLSLFSVYPNNEYSRSCTTSMLGESVTMFNKSEELQKMFYMDCVTCCSSLKSFNDLLISDQDIVDCFVKECAKSLGRKFNVTYTKVKDVMSEVMLQTFFPMHRIAASNNTDYCRLYIRKDKIVFEVATNLMGKHTLYEIKTKYRQKDEQLKLVVFGLYLLGIIIDWNSVYNTNENLIEMRAINVRNTLTIVNSLKEI